MENVRNTKRRVFRISAIDEETNEFYNSALGAGVTKEVLMHSFKQVSVLFGFKLTGQLIDNKSSED